MHQKISLNLNSDKQASCVSMLLILPRDSQDKNTLRRKALNLNNNAHYKIMAGKVPEHQRLLAAFPVAMSMRSPGHRAFIAFTSLNQFV